MVLNQNGLQKAKLIVTQTNEAQIRKNYFIKMLNEHRVYPHRALHVGMDTLPDYDIPKEIGMHAV